MPYTLPPVPTSWTDCVCPLAYAHVVNLLQNESAEVFPPAPLVWQALQLTDFHAVKVVIIGQDPYHAPNQAMGLAFSVPKGQATPPSLQNIYTELQNDMGVPIARHGDLTAWAEQGVLLLNTALTVRRATAASHKNIGWHPITTAIIQHINAQHSNIVFILWGGHAKSFRTYIDGNKHCILAAAHPSPLSANKGGFFGCRHFSRTNAYLQQHGKDPINWAKHIHM